MRRAALSFLSLSFLSLPFLSLAFLAFAFSAWAADRQFITAIEKQVHELLPTKAEKRFDEIGWARDVRQALALAKQRNRPMFLFTYDGLLATGRC